MNCPICGRIKQDICSYCLTQQKTCVLCFTKFELDEKVIRCKECFYLGHEENFSSWLKSEGFCPVCRNEYQEEGFEEIVLEDGTIRQHYLDKSSIFFKRQQIYSKFEFQHLYYEFQESVVEDIIAQLKFDESHLLISPPGSGKTIIGLAIASHFSVNTLVITPNLAVLGSWIDRLTMFFDEKESSLALQEIYTRSTGALKPITITTYQQINTSLRALETDRKNDKLRKSPVNYIDRLKEHNIGLLILDEAHRLTGQWGEDILRLIDEIGDLKILGLTATPPQTSDYEFDDLFNYRKTEIPLPLLVRQGVLVPYRDYAIILPSKPEDFLENTPPTSYDNVRKQLYRDTISELKVLYNQGSTGDYYSRWLSANLSIKTWITIRIILRESSNLGENFRGLILMDQENVPNKLPFKVNGNGGAIGIFDQLLKIEEIDALDPVFVTGKSLVIDKDFSDFFEEQSTNWLKEFNMDAEISVKKTRKKYAIVNGSGKDWNTETYTRFVTYLFENGHTKLLLGTRFLLGEGWDSQSLNTVIDLTTFATYSSVNQAKGRALRIDPNNPEKVSHLWEVAPNPRLSPLGSKEYKNYTERHEIYFGIDDRGKIRNGVDRLNPYLRKTKVMDLTYYNQLSRQLSIDGSRSEAKQLWKVGQDLGDLYYTVRIGISTERKIPKKLRDQVITFLELVSEQFISKHIPENFLVQTKSIQDYTRNFRFQVLVTIPMSVDYDNIVKLEEELLKVGTKGLGLYVYSYSELKLPFVEKLKKWLFRRPRDLHYQTILLKLPWELESIDKKNFAGLSEPIPLDQFQVQKISKPLNKNKYRIMGEITNSISFYDIGNRFYHGTVVQYFSSDNSKKTAFKPSSDLVVDFEVVDTIVEQQYIDHVQSNI